MSFGDDTLDPSNLPVPYSPAPEAQQLIEWAPTQYALAQALEVRDLQSYDAADGAMTAFSADLKKLEEIKEQAVRPLRNALKQIADVIDPAINALKDAKSLLGTRMGNYNRRQEEIAKAIKKEAETQARAANIDPSMVVEVKAATAERGKTKYRDNWQYEIEEWSQFVAACCAAGDFEALAPNEKVLKARAKAAGAAAKKGQLEADSGVAGLRFFNKRITVN